MTTGGPAAATTGGTAAATIGGTAARGVTTGGTALRTTMSGVAATVEPEAANNYAASLRGLERFEEALSLLRKIVPVARRVLGEGHRVTLKTRWSYGLTLYMDPGATLDDLREAVTTLEDARRIALRVFGGAHPVTGGLGRDLCKARFTLSIRETPSPGSA